MDMQLRKKDFPIFATHPTLVYLDTAATSLTPQSVIDATRAYYTTFNANVARGVYDLSVRATQECAAAREKVASFVGAPDAACVIFTSGTTMSLNMVATGLASRLTAAHNVVTTIMEHHANFVPWQRLCRVTGASFRVAPLTDDGIVDAERLCDLVDNATAIVALTYVSNTLGSVNPVATIARRVRAQAPNAMIVVDAAQAAAHLPLDIQELGCDLYAFSLHKMYGPTGVGVLTGTRDALERLEPLCVGGEMIASVSTRATTYADLPERLEGGTPNIAGIVGAGAAVDYMRTYNRNDVLVHERDITRYCIARLRETFGDAAHIYGPTDPALRGGSVSFTLDNCHPHDVASIADEKKHVALRAGQHCTMPLHLESLHVGATLRASFGVYTTKDDIDTLIDSLVLARTILT